MEIISGIIAIWAACAFWAVMFLNLDIAKSRRNEYKYPIAIIASIAVAPYVYILWMRDTHEDSRWT